MIISDHTHTHTHSIRFAQREMHSMMNEDEVAHEQMLSKLLPSLTKLEEDNNQLRDIARTEEMAAQEALEQARREHTEAVSAVMELETTREETRKMLETEIRLAQDRDAAVQLAEEFERKFELMENSKEEDDDDNERVSKCADNDTEALSIRNNELRLQLKRMECAQYTTRRNMRMDVTIVKRVLGQTLSLLRGRTFHISSFLMFSIHSHTQTHHHHHHTGTLVKYAHGRGGGIANRFVSLHCARASTASLDSDSVTWVVGSIMSQYVVFEREAREFLITSHFYVLISPKNITRIAHSKKSTLEYELDYDENLTRASRSNTGT